MSWLIPEEFIKQTKQQQIRTNYIKEINIKSDAKDEILSNLKIFYCFILLLANGQFSGHDHTILINEYQRNYDVLTNFYYNNTFQYLIILHLSCITFDTYFFYMQFILDKISELNF